MEEGETTTAAARPRWRAGLVRLVAAPAGPWCLVFVIMCVTVWYDGGMNAASRFATMRAVSARHTLRINRYVDWNWTSDWALTPDGRYYSNKAPGPALLALPVAWMMDQGLFAWDPSLRHVQPPLAYKTLISVLYQVLPCAVVVLLASQMLARRGASPRAQSFAALGILFGNTASVYMNSYYGHGMTAWLLLAVALALLAERPALTGCLFGLALLCDYGVGLLVLPFLVAFFARREPWPARRQRALYLAAGAALPAALWIWYHTVCFGSPFTIALSYQNPAFRNSWSGAHEGLRAVLNLPPRWSSVWWLLSSRPQGVLLTQPWSLVAYGIALGCALRRRCVAVPASLTILVLSGLPLLLWFNAGFEGAHGGWVVGPRYLSPVMAFMALYVALVYDRLGVWVRRLLWLTLIPAVILRTLIYAAPSPYQPVMEPVWAFFWRQLAAAPFGAGGLRALTLVSLLLLAAWQLHGRRAGGRGGLQAGAALDQRSNA